MTAAHTATPWKAKFNAEPGLSEVAAAWWQLLDGLHAQTPIMTTRPLVRDEKVAIFSDNRWPLTLALHQAHAGAVPEALVVQYRLEGRPLPGRATETGVELDFVHLGRLLDARPWGIRRRRRSAGPW
jgi:hypothetical protein